MSRRLDTLDVELAAALAQLIPLWRIQRLEQRGDDVPLPPCIDVRGRAGIADRRCRKLRVENRCHRCAPCIASSLTLSTLRARRCYGGNSTGEDEPAGRPRAKHLTPTTRGPVMHTRSFNAIRGPN